MKTEKEQGKEENQHVDTNICIQCGKEFNSWERFEELGGEINSFEEYDCCSYECDNEWRLDNREELCN